MQVLKIVLICLDVLTSLILAAAMGHVKTNGSAVVAGVISATMAINALVIYFA